MAKVLITGSKGVIGTQLTKLLQARGHTVFGIDLRHEPAEAGWEHEMSLEQFTYARCDVGNYRQLERVFEKMGPFDFVYHTAAEFGRWNGEDYYEEVWKTNVIGTKNIIRLQEKYKFKLIHFSSSEVYGDFDGIMKEEVMDQQEIKQLNDYAMSKWVSEMQIKNSFLWRKTETVVVRLFCTYGPGEWYHPYRGVLAKFCYHALMKIPIVVYRGGERGFTWIDDACNALANIIDNFKPGETYNISATEYCSIEKLAEIIWNYIGADKSLIRYEDSEVMTAKSKKVNVDKSIRDLGFKNTMALEEGIKSTINWMREYYNIKD